MCEFHFAKWISEISKMSKVELQLCKYCSLTSAQYRVRLSHRCQLTPRKRKEFLLLIFSEIDFDSRSNISIYGCLSFFYYLAVASSVTRSRQKKYKWISFFFFFILISNPIPKCEFVWYFSVVVEMWRMAGMYIVFAQFSLCEIIEHCMSDFLQKHKFNKTTTANEILSRNRYFFRFYACQTGGPREKWI